MTLSRKILSGFIICAVILAGVAFFSYKNNQKSISSGQWVDHTHQVLYDFEQVQAASTEMQSVVRGYVITGNENFIENYDEIKRNINQNLDKLQELTHDNPVQQRNIEILKTQISEYLDYQNNLIALRKGGFQKPQEIVSSGAGKQLQDSIKKVIIRAITFENTLLTERRITSETETQNFNSLFNTLLIIIAIVFISVYLLITANLRALKRAEQESSNKNWLLTGNFELNEKTRGEQIERDLAKVVISQICNYLNAQIGAIYLIENGDLTLTGSFAFHSLQQDSLVIAIGEGLVGQAALEKKTILFTEVPADYIKINSSLGNISPKNIIVIPLLQDGSLKGVIEIGASHKFSDLDIQFLNMISENLAIVFSAAQSRSKLKELLEETQRQSEELETQQEELKQSNEELQEKTDLLERSEAELKAQQEELQQTNEELEEKANLLEEQKEKLEIAKTDIEIKAGELEITGKYKSEFLANMSHELRTPLNSILILSQLLSENKSKTLGEKEIDFAKNIHNSGADLLNLIDEILDLSKVESGKIELDIAQVPVNEIHEHLSSMFTELAKSKSVQFEIENKGPEFIITDKQRLEQILKNLLSNAFKFTHKQGKVSLTISALQTNVPFRNEKLLKADGILMFEVTDTGVGIPADKQEVIFEAFQQADGSTKRKYGGTGLGLSISRELAAVLGGEIRLNSEEGKGSSFTLYLPVKFETSFMSAIDRTVEIKDNKPTELSRSQSETHTEDISNDDRYHINISDKVILIIEDDVTFSNILLDFVRSRNYKGIITAQGNTGLSYARSYKPDAIILDMQMPVMNGTEVLRHLKTDPELRHIPVQIISGYDKEKESMELGAFDFLQKPVTTDGLKATFDKIDSFISKKLKKLLIVEDDETQNKAIRELIGNGDVKAFSAFSGQEAFDMLNTNDFDCVILDLGLPDVSEFDLLEKIKSNDKLKKLPIIIYTGKELSKDENTRLMKFADTVVLKTANSQERLLDETMLFLHRVESKLPKEKQNIIRRLYKTDEILKDKKVLIADDDIRNIYSLTNVLEEEGMQCIIAENGKMALKLLNDDPSIEIVLMDIMMPEMDGYEATKEIRSLPQFSKLPIIALTAKAMKGDKEKCLNVGMSDYIAKPVNIQQLLSLMRVWLYS
jgi:CheY-like chemotaxis protein/CHASE3 domain sensor protein/putative methionine-R-sulfoxide reductase with GAF domain